ncbi:hypothetical protein Bca101_067724 [Brassica carinata]
MISKITKAETAQEVPVPTVFVGAITRQRAKVVQHKFNESMMFASDLGQVKPADEVTEETIKKNALKIRELAKKIQEPSEDVWPLIPEHSHNNLMIITIEDQLLLDGAST